MLAFGAQIEFQDGFFAKVDSIKHSGMKREDIETTHLRTGYDGLDDEITDDQSWKTFVPAPDVDPGELELELQHDATLTPPLFEDVEDITITWMDGTEEHTETCHGYMSSYEIEGAKDGLVMATAKLKLSGTVEFA